MKRIFYTSLGLLVLVLIFLGAYNVAFRHNVNSPVAAPEEKQAAEMIIEDVIPEVGRFENPVNEDVIGAVSGPDDKLYYYSLDDHSIKRATFDGKDKEVLMSDMPGTPDQVIWSPKRARALLHIRQLDGAFVWHYADLATRSLVALKPGVARVAWNNLGDKIFYQYVESVTAAKSLNMSNPDGSDWKKLSKLEKDSFIASVPQSSLVSFWNKPNAFDQTFLETSGISGDARKALFTSNFGADYLWSPDGEHVLVSASSEKGGHSLTLGIMNRNGGQFRDLFLPTLVSKVVWSADNRTIYYALPGSLPETAVLPNDYFGKLLPTKDTFWKMDIETGRKTRLVDLADVTASFDSADLFLGRDERELFFTDRQTHRLYRVDL